MSKKKVRLATWKGVETNEQNGTELSQRLFSVIFDVILVLIFTWAGRIMLEDVFGFGEMSIKGIFGSVVVAAIVSGIMEFIDSAKTSYKRLIKGCVPLAGTCLLSIYIFIFKGGEKIIGGLINFAAEYIQKWNVYYKTGIKISTSKINSVDFGVGFIFMVLIFLAVWLSKCTGKRLFLSLISIFVVGIEVTVGYAPSVKGFMMMLVGILLANTLEYDKADFVVSIKERTIDSFRRKYMYMLYVSMFIVIGCLGLKVVVTPSVKDSLKYSASVKAIQKSMLENFSISDIIQSIGENLWNKNKNGEIISNMALSFKDVPVFRMYTDRMPKDKMYIKGFYGAQYVGGKWINDGDDFEKAVKEAGFDVEEVKKNISLMGKIGVENYFVYNSSHELYPMKATLEYLKKNNKVAYVPYFSDVYSEIDIEGGVYYEKDKELTKISYLLYQENLDYEKMGVTSVGEYQEEWEIWYEEYVCDNYLSLPGGMDGIKDIAKDLMSNNNLQTIEGVPGENVLRARAANVVAEWMAKNMNYTTEPPSLPRNADPVEYFVSQSKEGYCMHYASAATLILREMGVPARYVSGYYVDESGFKIADKDYMNIIMDNAAHAWVEVFLDGMGWIPLEVTTTYYDGRNPNAGDLDDDNTTEEKDTSDATSTTQEPASGEVSSSEATSSSNETASSGNSGLSGKEEESTKGAGFYGANNDTLRDNIFVKVLVIAAFAIVMPLGIYMILRHFRLKEEKLKLLVENKKKVRAIKIINRNIYIKLKKKGKLIGSKHTDEAYKEALIKAFPEVSKQEWDRYMDIVKEMAFSNNDGNVEDMEYCYEIYKRVRYQKMRKDEATVKKNKRIIIIIVAVAIIGLLIWWISSMNGIPKIKAEDVARIYYDGPEFNDNKELDIEEFIGYYNEIYDIKENKLGEGTTPESWVVIELKSGEEIIIYDQSKKFEVNFENGRGKIKQYWGKQEQIYNMLRHGSYEGEE